MRYTRFELPGRNKTGVNKILLQFFIVMPALAIICGYLISNLIIIPSIGRTDKREGKSDEAAVFNAAKLEKLHFLQAGYFVTKEKAVNLVNGINGSGMKAFLGQNNGHYRVITAFSNSMEDVQKALSGLKDLGYNGIVNTMDIQKLNKSGSEDLKLIREYINIVGNLINSEQELLNSSSNGFKGEEQLKVGLEQLNNSFNGLSNIVIPDGVKDELISLNSSFLENNNKFIENGKSGKMDECQQNIGNQIVSLFDFYKVVIQNYMN